MAIGTRSRPETAAPSWDAVEDLLARLAGAKTRFPSALADENWISTYEPGERLRFESPIGGSWVRIASVMSCWETFERLGRICRQDVLEPGRCSAFMMAVFQQVPGVREEAGSELHLVLGR